MKAEALWAKKLSEGGCTLPRGKAFRATTDSVTCVVAPVAKPRVEKITKSADIKNNIVLTDAQKAAIDELTLDWQPSNALSARKQTLNALAKKGVIEVREDDGNCEYRLPA